MELNTILFALLGIFIASAILSFVYYLWISSIDFEDDTSDEEYLSDEIDYKFTHSTEIPDEDAPDYEWLSDILRGR